MRITLVMLFVLLAGPARAEFKNDSEAGVVNSTGNSRSQSLNFKQGNNYVWERNSVGFKGNFLQSKSQGILDAKRWGLELRYDRSVSERLSFFVTEGVESDRFAGFMQRHNSGVGSKYVFYREEKAWDWFGELGYRYTRERLLTSARVSKNQVRAYTEVNHEWRDGISSKYWVEYMPNFSNGKDWELNTELSSSAAVTNVFSVKIAYLVKYDSLPAPGAISKTDRLFTTSLVAKY